MKRLLLAGLLAGLAWTASALDVSEPRTFTVSIDALALFSSELSINVEYRFAPAYSAGLQLSYGYGGRAARAEGNFLELEPFVNSFVTGVGSSDSNWYLTVLGKARFSLLDDDVRYGAGAGFGGNFLLNFVLLNPQITSELFFGEDFRLGFQGNVGTKN